MQRRLLYIFLLSFGGLLFSGYLSAVKFFSNVCAFNEACPYFWGYPACWYGFAMYLTMFIILGINLLGKISTPTTLKWILAISAIGIIFSGNFVLQEISNSTLTGKLGLSTCAYGLIFYVLILTLGLSAWRKTRR